MVLAAASSSDPTTVLLNYGAVGAMVVILLAFAYQSYKRERDRADYLFTMLQNTNEKISEKFADTLKETRDALVASNDYLRDLARRRQP